MLSTSMTTKENTTIEWLISEHKVIPKEVPSDEAGVGQVSVGPKPSPVIMIDNEDNGLCAYLQVSSEGTVGATGAIYLSLTEDLMDEIHTEIDFQDMLDDDMLSKCEIVEDKLIMSTTDLTPQKAFLTLSVFNSVLQILATKAA